MKGIIRLFKIRAEERVPALVFLLLSAALHALVIYSYYDKLSEIRSSYKWFFVKTFHISGYDPLTYNVVTNWEMRYNVFRHPLLAPFMYVPSVINQGLMELTGINCVQFVVALILLLFTVYSFVFLFRIFREVLEMGYSDSLILTALHYSFAYVIVASVCPDHFAMSMSVLIMMIYVSGMRMKRGRPIGKLQTIWIFLLTAGISLNNGIKIFLAALFVNGRRFFRPLYLLFAVILPSLLIWVFLQWEYNTFVYPDWKANKDMKARIEKKEEAKIIKTYLDTVSIADTARQKAGAQALIAQKKAQKKRERSHSAANRHTGKPIEGGGFLKWTDITTSRTETAVHNLFGESIILHSDHLLEDVLRSRPVIVEYGCWLNYLAEFIIVSLFVAGVWLGRRNRFLWLALSYFAFDMVIHMGLGFGINEIYIMSPHWLFTIAIAIGYALRSCTGRLHTGMRSLILILTLYMYIYNVALLAEYLL